MITKLIGHQNIMWILGVKPSRVMEKNTPPPHLHAWWVLIKHPKNHIREKVLLVTLNHFVLKIIFHFGKKIWKKLRNICFFSLKCVLSAIIYHFCKIQKSIKKIYWSQLDWRVEFLFFNLHIFLLNAIFNYLLFHWIINKNFPFSNAMQCN